MSKDKKKLDGDLALASVAIASGFSSLLGLSLSLLEQGNYLEFYTGSVLVTSPFIYYGLNKLKEKINDRQERDKHFISQLILMADEFRHKDHTITKMTSFFFKEIDKELSKEQVTISDDDLMNINQFLYLINSNYYDKISTYLPTIHREELIKRIIRIIVLSLKENNKSFNEETAKEILNKCFFIKEEDKQTIINDFKKSKIKMGDKITYQIKRNDLSPDIDAYINAYNEEVVSKEPTFDIKNIKHYEQIVSALSEHEYPNELGNPNEIEWDYKFIKGTMNLINDKFRSELLQEHENHNNYYMVRSFLANALIYALVNNKKKIGPEEILKTFKFWDYVPFKLQLAIIDDILEEAKLSYDHHPYEVKQPKTGYQKIIKMPKREA